MDNFAERFNQILQEQGIKKIEVATALGISRAAVTKWATGLTAPADDRLPELAEILGVSVSRLQGQTEAVPVLGRVAAGLPNLADEEIIGYVDVPQEVAKGGRLFALQIHGESMKPRMCEGDIVIVREQSDADSGDIVIAMVGDEDACCKRLKKFKKGIALQSYNPKFKTMKFSAQDVEKIPVRIIGKVIELRAKI